MAKVHGNDTLREVPEKGAAQANSQPLSFSILEGAMNRVARAELTALVDHKRSILGTLRMPWKAETMRELENRLSEINRMMYELEEKYVSI